MQRSMVLRGSSMHVVSPLFRLPQRLYDRFLSLFLLKFLDLTLLLTPFVDSAPPHPSQALIDELVMLAMVLVATATLLLQARVALAAIQVPRAEKWTLMATSAKKTLPQFLTLLLMSQLCILPSLPWFILSLLPLLLSA